MTKHQSTQQPADSNMVAVEGGKLPESSELNGTEVQDFEIGKYTVTWQEWQPVHLWAMANGYEIHPGEGNGNRHPVTMVSWYDAVKWCNAKSEMEGLQPVYIVDGAVYKIGETDKVTVSLEANGYKLPTEAEWEWAARGGCKSQGYTFAGSDDLEAVGWFSVNCGDIGLHEVGEKDPNELGIHDMSGNVYEWCEDEVAPGDDAEPLRRMRGGCFADDEDVAEVANRCFGEYLDGGSETSGFRLARRSG